MGHHSELTATRLLAAIACNLDFRRAAMIGLFLSIGSINVSAQEYRGTDEQRTACTGDVFRLCWSEIPNVSRIVGCLQRERPRLSAGCRAVFEPTNTRLASNRWQRRHQRLATTDRPQTSHEHNAAPATAPVEVANASHSPAPAGTSGVAASHSKHTHLSGSHGKHVKVGLRSHGKGKYGRLHRHRLALDTVKQYRHHNHKG